MNSKKAKKLRKFARQMATTENEVQYTLTKKHLINYPGLPKPIMCGTVELDENCARSLYKKLKRGI